MEIKGSMIAYRLNLKYYIYLFHWKIITKFIQVVFIWKHINSKIINSTNGHGKGTEPLLLSRRRQVLWLRCMYCTVSG